MVNLYNDPLGEKIFQKSNPSAGQDSSSGTRLSLPIRRKSSKPEGQENGDLVQQLQKRVQEMEKEMAMKERNIKKLETELNSIKVCEVRIGRYSVCYI